MATKEFILQGFTARIHAEAVREMFAVDDIQRVLLSVAFVSESGVQHIENELRANAPNVVVFAGIRNDITSYQGLLLLHSIIGNGLHTVDTGARTVLFHPKIYMVRGAARARIIIGSANLTLGGLNNNIEAGMLLDLDLNDPSDKATVDSVETQLLALPANYAANILSIGAVADLDTILASGRLADEMAIPPPRPTASATTATVADQTPKIALQVPRIFSTVKRRPAAPAAVPAQQPVAAPAAPTQQPAATPGVDLELVWESKPLSRRDLQIPTGANTHPTGDMNLDKGLLDAAIDHRDYFRNEVFDQLTWGNRTATLDDANAVFQLIIKGIDYGLHALTITHHTSTTSESYLQRNAMTKLKWGAMRPFIAKDDLIGRTLALYRDKNDHTKFVLEID